MSTQYTHYGLIFTAQDVENAKTHRDQTPYADAWAQFEAIPSSLHFQNDVLVDKCIYNALRWRLLGDVDSGALALENFSAACDIVGAQPSFYFIWVKMWFGLIQAYECLRDHPAYDPLLQSTLSDAAFQWVGVFSPMPEYDPTTQSMAWQYAVRMAIGVALENTALVESTAARVRALIETIHPAGFIPSVISQRPNDLSNFDDTLKTIHGLALAAEVAAHVGIDLWGHQKRAVSLMTAAFYPLYYFYYPEKWKWGEGLTLETVQGMFRSHAGFLELINRRRPNVRAVNMILTELRPVIDLTGGGALTLTHQPLPSKKRGFFG